jgi:hypothetical protein
VLVATDVIIYAGHCGTQTATAWFGDVLKVKLNRDSAAVVNVAGVKKVGLHGCRVHPDAGLALGNDVAFCFLDAPFLDERRIVPMALGCARAQLAVDVPMTLVGYGVDSSGNPETLGVKRSLSAPIAALGREIVVGDEQHGPCAGDSGGPAVVSIIGSDQVQELALAGILSSGVEGTTCSAGFYTDLSQVAAWLEGATGRDLTPCFDGARWHPSPFCKRAALDEQGVPIDGPSELSQLCGEPFRMTPSGGCSQTSRLKDPPNLTAIIGVLVTLMCGARRAAPRTSKGLSRGGRIARKDRPAAQD